MPSVPETRVRTTDVAVIPVVAAVVSRRGDYLVCRRPPAKRHGGCWEFPGGKVAPGEADHDALQRELREELDVAVVWIGACRFVAREPAAPFRIAFYETEISGQPRALEHSAIDWLSPSQLGDVPLAPVDRRFVERCLLGRPRLELKAEG
jgi:8-oxo-dGTP diphosphatase